MRALEFSFHPQQVEISAEEILADLNYPASATNRSAGTLPVPQGRHPRR